MAASPGERQQAACTAHLAVTVVGRFTDKLLMFGVFAAIIGGIIIHVGSHIYALTSAEAAAQVERWKVIFAVCVFFLCLAIAFGGFALRALARRALRLVSPCRPGSSGRST